MKVLLVNGSAKERGCTYTALAEIEKVLAEEGIESEIFQLGNKVQYDCIGCGVCRTMENGCVFKDDIVNTLIQHAKDADGFVFGSPVYYAHPSGRLLSALDRMFFSSSSAFAHKPGMAVVSARRGGTTASFDVINKYFTIAQMPVVSSTYWNMVHGSNPEEVKQDKEGLQTMRNGARNLAWLMKCIALGKQSEIMPPVAEKGNQTNFIR